MYSAVMANALAAGALVHYGRWLGRAATPITWEGMVFPFTVSPNADPDLPFWFSSPGGAGGALLVTLDAQTADGSSAGAEYVVLMLGWSAGLGWNASGGEIQLETPGVFGLDTELLEGPTIWGSASWFAYAFTGMTMGMAEIKKLEVGKIFGPDFGVEFMSGWSWLYGEPWCKGPSCR